MVTAFPEAGDARPESARWRARGEAGSVPAPAVRSRLGGQDSSPRAFARGEAVRLAALLGPAFLAAVSIATVIHQALPGGPGGVTGAPWSPDRLPHVLGLAESDCWVAAFLALVRERPSAARRGAVLALAPVLVATAVRAGGEEPVPQAAAWPALTAVPVAALLLAHHRDTLPVTLPGPCAPAPLAAGVVVGVVRPAVPQPGPESWFRLWTGPVGLGVLGLAAGAVVCVAPRTRAPVAARPGRAGGAAGGRPAAGPERRVRELPHHRRRPGGDPGGGRGHARPLREARPALMATNRSVWHASGI